MHEQTSIVKKVRELTKLTQKEFARIYDIPLRTLQDWEREVRKPPEYLEHLLVRLVLLENMIPPAWKYLTTRMPLASNLPLPIANQDDASTRAECEKINLSIFKRIEAAIISRFNSTKPVFIDEYIGFDPNKAEILSFERLPEEGSNRDRTGHRSKFKQGLYSGYIYTELEEGLLAANSLNEFFPISISGRFDNEYLYDPFYALELGAAVFDSAASYNTGFSFSKTSDLKEMIDKATDDDSRKSVINDIFNTYIYDARIVCSTLRLKDEARFNGLHAIKSNKDGKFEELFNKEWITSWELFLSDKFDCECTYLVNGLFNLINVQAEPKN